ncbi:hypothetical protein GCM10027047_02990 [Rhodococcus aerolatus]
MTDQRADPTVLVPAASDGTRRRVDLGPVGVCSVHGETAVVRWDKDVLGHPRSRWSIVGMTPLTLWRHYGDYVASTVHIATVGWPLCETCAARVRRRVAVVRSALGVGAVSVVVALVLAVAAGSSPWLMIPFLGGAGLLVASLFLAGRVSMRSITGAHAALDGSAVVVDDPHPAFRAAVAASFP